LLPFLLPELQQIATMTLLLPVQEEPRPPVAALKNTKTLGGTTPTHKVRRF
jgi:hypothetical protein